MDDEPNNCFLALEEAVDSGGPIAKPAAHDPVKRPAHYTWIPGIECRAISRHFSSNAGQAIQYIYRHRHKGKPVEDLRKAIECLQDEIALLMEQGL
jgi:hypothetical protein